VHEFGHFIVAKLTNMRVDEFAFGFPPRLFGKKIGETTYSVNALPIGGYVSIWGENGSADDVKHDGATHNSRAFGNRPWWAKLLVLVAGVTMNMVLALVIFIAMSYGQIEMSSGDPVYGTRVKNTVLMVVDAAPESPAYKAGIVPGSVLLKLTSSHGQATLKDSESLVNYITDHNNDAYTITYKKPDGTVTSTTIAAVYGIVENKKAIGISVDTIGTLDTSLLDAITIGCLRTVNMTLMTLSGLKSVAKTALEGKSVINSLSGPIGIAKIVKQTSDYGVHAVLTLTAVLSINLAIFNILPLPALDGGRMIIVIIETVFRRKMPFKYFSWMNTIGFALLLLLLVLVTVHDIRG
jgi:regulator of sigma E protease